MGRKCKDFDDKKREMEATLDDITKFLDGFQINEHNTTDAEMLNFAKRNNDRAKQLLGIRYYRRLLCKDNNPHVQEVINLDLVRYFVDALKADDCPILQMEAAWALTNISAGSCEDAKVVIENGALPLLVEFTRNRSVDLKEQALWAIGNIAAEKSFLKALVDRGALDRVLTTLEVDGSEVRLIRIAIWVLTNFCRYGFDSISVTSDYIPRIVSAIIALIQHNDRKVMLDAAWAIASFTSSEWPTETRELLVQRGVLQHLASTIIYTERPTLQYPALKALAQILSGPESYSVEFLTIEGIMKKLKIILTDQFNRKAMANVLWLLQNIAANRYKVAKSLINTGLINRIIELVIYGPHELKVEAGNVLINLFYCHDLSLSGIDALVAADAITALCRMLTWEPKKYILDAMNSLDRILIESGKPAAQKWFHLCTADESTWVNNEIRTEKRKVRVRHHQSSQSRSSAIAQRIRLAGGDRTIRLLVDHGEKEISNSAITMWNEYFQSDEETISLNSNSDDDDSDTAVHGSAPNGASVQIEVSDEEEEEIDQDEMALCENVQSFNFGDGHGVAFLE
eukprot:g185.t1